MDIPIGGDAAPLLDLYRRYRENPVDVPLDWRLYFEDQDREDRRGNGISGADAVEVALAEVAHAFQRYGHLAARTDPLGQNAPSLPEEIAEALARLDRALAVLPAEEADMRVSARETLSWLQRLYCGPIGAEFMHIADTERRRWMRDRFEASHGSALCDADRLALLTQLVEADEFERFCRLKFPTRKRFGAEGAETMLCFMHAVLQSAAHARMPEAVIGGMHRGRLNVLCNVLRKPLAEVLAEVGGRDFFDEAEHLTGDVPYHLGHSGVLNLGAGEIRVSLSPHPSHLLTVAAYTMGRARAKRAALARETGAADPVLCVQMHTDAAISGQGLGAELVQLSELPGFSVGGTIHLVVNNRIGFTTTPAEGRSSRYCTDLAKLVDAPVLHVNADDPEAVWRAARLAFDWRCRFRSDVFVDLVCYRRNGHNELDEPRFTQPLQYEAIAAHPPVRRLYAQGLSQNVETAPEAERVAEHRMKAALTQAFEASATWQPNRAYWLTGKWHCVAQADEAALGLPVETAVHEAQLQALGRRLCETPAGFSLNPKVKKFLADRRASILTARQVNWATAEALAIASLLAEGHPVRISGQDVVRGTFTQRHWALHDMATGAVHMPLEHLTSGQGAFEAVNSPLAEYSVLSFEYGHSLVDPHQLTIWEAQFGDFANGAQTVIDQAIVPSEARWRRMSGLVMLLPHGLEGQGPDHSTCRLERFLAMCADSNIIVVNCSTPANFFHALRRQLRAPYRKPLIVAAPKSLLRHPRCLSNMADLATGSSFSPVLPPACTAIDPAQVARVVLCSGKLRYDLETALETHPAADRIVLLSIEQLYPFPHEKLAEALAPFSGAEIIWCQEEPRNQGAWSFVRDEIGQAMALLGNRAGLRCISRPARPAPAGGSQAKHEEDQRALVLSALDVPRSG